jgi:hypothetical protein
MQHNVNLTRNPKQQAFFELATNAALRAQRSTGISFSRRRYTRGQDLRIPDPHLLRWPGSFPGPEAAYIQTVTFPRWRVRRSFFSESHKRLARLGVASQPVQLSCALHPDG